MSAIRRTGWTAAAVLVLSGIAGGVAGCGSGSGSGPGGGSAATPGVVHADAAGGGAVLGYGKSASPSSSPAVPPAALSRSVALGKSGAQLRLPSAVIKTADLVLRVDHGQFGASVRRVRAVAQRFGGFVSQSHAAGTRTHSGSVTLRVPAVAFGKALDALEGVGKVTAESVTGQDVSQEFVDLHARLVNLRAQERVLLRLMNRAQTIAESIRVENYLQNVEFQIEDVQGRILYLQNRTSMSTIAVVLHETGAKPVVRHHASSLWKAGARSLHTALAVVTGVIVGAGFVVPVAILALVALVLGRRVAPFAAPLLAGRRRAAPGPSPSGEG